jgi:hypothetical protein
MSRPSHLAHPQQKKSKNAAEFTHEKRGDVTMEKCW